MSTIPVPRWRAAKSPYDRLRCRRGLRTRRARSPLARRDSGADDIMYRVRLPWALLAGAGCTRRYRVCHRARAARRRALGRRVRGGHRRAH